MKIFKIIVGFSFQEENTEAESDDEREKEDGNAGNEGKMMFSLLHVDDEFSIREKKRIFLASSKLPLPIKNLTNCSSHRAAVHHCDEIFQKK